ncbi:MAG: hypothetical protein P8099_16750 [Gemmatimonadota bacterium]|jgi:hypothetical protein
MRTMRILTLALATTLAAAACSRAPKLDTRTFHLEYLSGSDARAIIAPYVYGDREGAPGKFSTSDAAHTISVRETPDNLDKIARVLKENDKAPAVAHLTFQVIRADGRQTVDPAISDVEQELEHLFRYGGYALVGQASLGALNGSYFEQTLPTGGKGGPPTLRLSGKVTNIRQATDSAAVSMQIDFGGLIQTSVDIGNGKAVVLGAPLGDGAIILVVRANIQAGTPEAG